MYPRALQALQAHQDSGGPDWTFQDMNENAKKLGREFLQGWQCGGGRELKDSL